MVNSYNKIPVLGAEIATHQSHPQPGKAVATWPELFKPTHCTEAKYRIAEQIVLTEIVHDCASLGVNDAPMVYQFGGLAVPMIASGDRGMAQQFVKHYELGARAIDEGCYCLIKRDTNPLQCRSQIRKAGITTKKTHHE